MTVLDFRASHPPIVRFGRQRERRLGREGRRVARVARAARRRHVFFCRFRLPLPRFRCPDRAQVLTRHLVTALALRRRRARRQWHGERALRSQRPRVLRCFYHSSKNPSAPTTLQRAWSWGPRQGEQQASSTGDCNYTSERQTAAALLSQAHRRSTASHQCTAKAPQRSH